MLWKAGRGLTLVGKLDFLVVFSFFFPYMKSLIFVFLIMFAALGYQLNTNIISFQKDFQSRKHPHSSKHKADSLVICTKQKQQQKKEENNL